MSTVVTLGKLWVHRSSGAQRRAPTKPGPNWVRANKVETAPPPPATALPTDPVPGPGRRHTMPAPTPAPEPVAEPPAGPTLEDAAPAWRFYIDELKTMVKALSHGALPPDAPGPVRPDAPGPTKLMRKALNQEAKVNAARLVAAQRLERDAIEEDWRGAPLPTAPPPTPITTWSPAPPAGADYVARPAVEPWSYEPSTGLWTNIETGEQTDENPYRPDDSADEGDGSEGTPSWVGPAVAIGAVAVAVGGYVLMRRRRGRR